MALIERKIDNWSQSVSSLLDKPRMKASELKAAFDSNSNEIKNAINSIIDELTNSQGASNVATQKIDGVDGDNVQEVLTSISDKISKVDPYLGEPVAVSQGGTGSKTAQEALYKLGSSVRKNLFHNWYWIGGGSQFGSGRYPINQIAITQYIKSGRLFDRWYFVSGDNNAKITLDSTGLIVDTLSSTEPCEILQDFEFWEIDTKVTFSILYRNTTNELKMISGAGKFPPIGSDNGNILVDSSNEIALLLRYMKEKGTYSPDIWIYPNNRLILLAVKLEIGENQTLVWKNETSGWVLYEIPDFPTELAKCQRYYQIYSSQEMRPNTYIDCRPIMRKPNTGDITQGTIQINDITYYYNSAEL